MTTSSNGEKLALLRALAVAYPTAEIAVAKLAADKAQLGLPAAVIQVLSDVHGEYKKLRHVINNASGSLRPLVDALFADRLGEPQRRQLLNVLYYPREQTEILRPQLDADRWRDWVRETLRQQFQIVRALAGAYPREWVLGFFPEDRRELFAELLVEPLLRPDGKYVDSIIDALAGHDRALTAVREASRVVRNLSAAEIIVAGDLGDRGPRIDRVIDYLMRQPNVSIVWGNHDAEWMGACLGQGCLVASVLRFSCRYRRLSQLEEGYGLMVEPLECLARDVYGDDPAENFKPHGKGIRDDLLMARMQKAACIMELKLQAQTSNRHPEWGMEHRNLLHRINHFAGTVEIDGKTYPLSDRRFPTVNPADPYSLTREERTCMDRIRQSFVTSSRLWEHMKWVVQKGRMWTKRGDTLIFHACVPVDEKGNDLTMSLDGMERGGRDLMDAIDSSIRRAFRQGSDTVGDDADLFWYLWAGPRSPLFGKDKMATFEGSFLSDKPAQEELKNPYFAMIHDADFVRKIGREFGMGDDVLLVNGHVPVKIEQGEDPVKRGGNAVTIDGAFSEAYGDHGYTLILGPKGISLAQHAHFDSVEEVIRSGADMVPTMRTIRTYKPPRTVADTAEGEELAAQMEALEGLVKAYEEGAVAEHQ